MSIDNYINQIRTAVYGEEVRGSIIGALQQCYNDGRAGAVDTTARASAQNALTEANNASAALNDYRNVTDPRIQALEQSTSHDTDVYWQSRDRTGGTPIDNQSYWELGNIDDYNTNSSYAGNARARTPLNAPLYFKPGDIIYSSDPCQVAFVVFWKDLNNNIHKYPTSTWIGESSGGGVFHVTQEGYYRLLIARKYENTSENLGSPYKLSKYMHCIFPETLGAYNNGYILPTYYYDNDYWKNTISTVNGLVNNTINGISFCFITDPHFSDETNYSRSKYLLKDILAKTSVPFVICGGDMVVGQGDSFSINYAVNKTLEYQNYIGKDKFFTVRGNHDFSIQPITGQSYEGHTLNTNKTYSYLMKNQEPYCVHGDHEHMCWYIDIPNQRTRIVGLNSCDCQTSDGSATNNGIGCFVSQAQINWLINDVLGMTNYRYIFISHIPADPGLDNYWYMSTQQVFHDIIGAFRMRGKINAVYAQQSTGNMTVYADADFTNTSSIVVCHITGHTHNDVSNFDNKYTLWSITTGCDAYYNATVSYSDNTAFYNKTRGTTSEHLFDVFNVNYNSRTITAYRIGAYNSNIGRTRTWTYESDIESVSGTNILKDGTAVGEARHSVTTSENVIQNYFLNPNYDASTFAPNDGDEFTIKLKGTLGSGRTSFGLSNSNVTSLVSLTSSDYNSAKGYYEKDFTWTNTNASTGTVADNSYYALIQKPSNGSSNSTVNWIKLEPKNIIYNGESGVTTSNYEMRSYRLSPNRIQTGARYKITIYGELHNSGTDPHFGINLYETGGNYHVPLVQVYPSDYDSTLGAYVKTFTWNNSYYYSDQSGRPTRTVDADSIKVLNVPSTGAQSSTITSIKLEKVT